MKSHIVLVSGLCCAALSSACSTDAQSDAKAGSPSRPLHVTMADSQPADSPTSLAMRAFADEAKALSDGKIRIDTSSAGRYADNAGDAKVVEALTDGSIQLAVVPTRGWSDAGAASTEVLQAPFEIAGPEHFAAVAQDDALVSGALADLERLGAHGLAVFPERLRYLTSFGSPFLRPGDLQGMTLRSISSSVGRVLASLGATPVNPDEDQYAQMRAQHTIDGAETDLERAINLASGTTVTVDLVFYGKFDSFAANASWWDGLTKDQRAILTRAAGTVRDREVSQLPRSNESALAFCEGGGSLAVAGPENGKAFTDALASYTGSLDQDLLQQLRADGDGTDRAAAPACAPPPDGLDPADVRADGGAVPDGTYRFQYTEDLAREFNTQHPDGIVFEGDDAPGSWKTLTFTWVLRDGHYTFEMQRDSEPPLTVTGVYQVKGDQMLVELDPDIGNVVNRLRWKVAKDGSLRLTQVDALKRDFYYWLPWTLIKEG
jgi:TRAP-type C4-dicarboxylate transport system substrate-binding protein